jgi:hypothetical protein
MWLGRGRFFVRTVTHPMISIAYVAGTRRRFVGFWDRRRKGFEGGRVRRMVVIEGGRMFCFRVRVGNKTFGFRKEARDLRGFECSLGSRMTSSLKEKEKNLMLLVDEKGARVGVCVFLKKKEWVNVIKKGGGDVLGRGVFPMWSWAW